MIERYDAVVVSEYIHTGIRFIARNLTACAVMLHSHLHRLEVSSYQ